MTFDKKVYDRERVKVLRQEETSKEREARLARKRAWKQTEEGKRARAREFSMRKERRKNGAANVKSKVSKVKGNNNGQDPQEREGLGFIREQEMVNQARSPDPIKFEAGPKVRAKMSRKYTEVHLTLSNLAEDLRDHDAEVVLSVIHKYQPKIRKQVDWLSRNKDHTFNLPGYNHEAGEEEGPQQLSQTIRIDQAEF